MRPLERKCDVWPDCQPIFPGREARARSNARDSSFCRQTGSHIILRREEPYARAVVPDHKQIRMGTLRRIISDAGLTVEQFMELLGR